MSVSCNFLLIIFVPYRARRCRGRRRHGAGVDRAADGADVGKGRVSDKVIRRGYNDRTANRKEEIHTMHFAKPALVVGFAGAMAIGGMAPAAAQSRAVVAVEGSEVRRRGSELHDPDVRAE